MPAMVQVGQSELWKVAERGIGESTHQLPPSSLRDHTHIWLNEYSGVIQNSLNSIN
jgi:hypothetical protein